MLETRPTSGRYLYISAQEELAKCCHIWLALFQRLYPRSGNLALLLVHRYEVPVLLGQVTALFEDVTLGVRPIATRVWSRYWTSVAPLQTLIFFGTGYSTCHDRFRFHSDHDLIRISNLPNFNILIVNSGCLINGEVFT